MRKVFKDPIFIIVFLLLAVFLFLDLGDDMLWQDEAETAVLARNTLEFGFPRTFDGVNTVNRTAYTGTGKNYAWLYHPWFQFYLVGFFFAVLGESTFAARLPFAIFGLLSLPLAYRLAMRLFYRRDIARTASLFLVTSVSFLLLMRQCRYYALSVFFTLAVLLAYLDFIEKKRFAPVKLFFSLVFLFYSIHGVFIPVVVFLAVHYLFFHYNSKDLKKIAVFLAFLFVCTAPWFFYANSFRHKAPVTLYHLRRNFEFYIRTLNKYIIPVAFFCVSYIFRAVKKRSWKIALAPREKYVFKSLLIFIGISIAFFCVVDQRMIRYIVYLFPVFYIMTAFIICRWQKSRRLIANFLLLILITTNLLHSSLGYAFSGKFQEKFKSHIMEFIYEITHPYHGPVEGIVSFLKSHAKPGEVVKVPYNSDHPIIFYCKGLKIDNYRYLEKHNYPDWIVFRRFWAEGEETLNSPYFKNIQASYIKHEIEAPDIPWQNRPDELGYHKFKDESYASNKIIIFEKR